MTGLELSRFVDRKVLVVDDNKVNQKVISMNLKQLGITPDCVSSGKEAIDMALGKEYDMIIMDILMPGMNGVETAAAIRKLKAAYKSELPIIAWTVENVNGSELDYYEAGLDDILQKPVQLECLKKILSKYLAW